MKKLKEFNLLIVTVIVLIIVNIIYVLNMINLNTYLFFMISMIFMCIIVITLLYIDNKKEKKKEELNSILYYDQITLLPNKNKFLNDLSNLIKEKNEYCIVSVDVKNFKNFIDVNGNFETNRFLKYMGNILKENVLEGELLANINEDNFALALKYIDEESIKQRIEYINDQIKKFDKNININLSFGIYIINDRRFSPTLMLNKANVAKKLVEEQYDILYAFYDDNLKNDNIELSEIENYMEESLKHKDFIVYYQPKYNLNKKQIIGLESLVRWVHPKRGILFPNSFINIFEKNNFIMKLDLYVLEESCKTINKWEKNKIPVVPISVNLSRANLNNQNLISDIQKIVRKYNVKPEYIEFEFTESIIYNNMNNFLNIIQILHQIGYRVSIDDFGAGHSSLNILKNLPVDVLKIDKEFLSENSEKGEIIIANTISLAKQLNMKVIMEGVENKEQVSFLKKMKCDYVQGYYYNKPLPIREVEKLLKTNKK